jgi:hypothetical protein
VGEIPILEMRVALVFIEVPLLPVLAQYHDVSIERLYLHPDIVEGLETERLLHHDGVGFQFFLGEALDEEAVALVLKIAEDTKVLIRNCFYPDYTARETHVLVVSVVHTPLTEKVTCITPFLTRGEK